MRSFHQTLDIQAPPCRVWAVLIDIERWPEWTASMTSVRRLDSGPFRLGSRAHIRQPKLRPAVWEVTEFERSSFTWVSRQPGIRTTALHRVDPNGSYSRLTLSIEFSGPLAPVIGLLAGKLTGRYMSMEANGLKLRCVDLAQ